MPDLSNLRAPEQRSSNYGMGDSGNGEMGSLKIKEFPNSLTPQLPNSFQAWARHKGLRG